MSESTADDLRERLAKARADADAAVMGLIWLELEELKTALSAREDQAAAALREVTEALTEPLAHLAGLDAEITSADAKRAELAAQVERDDLDGEDPDGLALVRLRLLEWERRMTRLRSKRDFAESGYQPLYEQRDRARKALADIQAAKWAVLAAQLNPFGNPIAQATKAYIGYRQPYLNLVLIANDRESPEWEMAVAELEECCLRSAYRTDNLPSAAEQAARAMTAAMADATTSPPPPAPSAVELGKQLEVEMENKRLEGIRDHIEDRRYPPMGAIPVQKRSYMDAPRLRDMGLR